MLRKVVTIIAVALASGVIVILLYPVSGLLGAGFTFLLPGFYLAPHIPNWVLSGVDPGPANGVFVVFAISFFTWWSLCCTVGCVYLLRKQMRGPGA